MNPSINQFKVLPQSHLTCPQGTYSLTDHAGFGFDSKTNDYKVVVIKDIWLKETDERKVMHWATELFSLKSNSWREFDDADLPPPIEIWESSKVHTFVNNCCHWLGFVDEFGRKEDVVLSFDMTKEVFRTIDVPRIRESSKETSATLVPYDESTNIGVIVYPKRGIEKKFDIWVLRDYWDEGTWVKQYTIEPIEVMYKLVGFHGINQFLWTNKDEDEPNGYISSHLLNPSNEFNSDHKYWNGIMGPCNGIYFLEGNPYVMMNPSINQFKVLPQSHLTCPQGTYSLTDHAGFGFDSKTNDYKVVVIKDIWLKETDERKLMHWSAKLFSLKSNSWREFDDDDLPPPIEIWESSKVHTFVNNCCHWLGFVDEFGRKEDVVLSFDMVKEVFRKIDVPRIRKSSNETFATLVPFNESTSISVIVYPIIGIEKKVDVWVLRDYWDEGTWIKQYTIEPLEVMSKLVGFHGINQFLWTNKDEELILYDGDPQQIKHLQVKGKNNSLRVVVYMESLVSIRSTNDSNYQFVSCNFVNDHLLNTRE
ncbi:unnamed protein product [Lupinus luteus]|uniref:F-box associated beta-propeller type 1 domain-containing protein n=1 Tax=Lupinus luteus TaxID=3873 RepID=A0AAV1XB12_LUPLU